MTLSDAKELLKEQSIPYEKREYKSEEEYWHHTMLFPYTKKAKPCKVIAIIIKSNNGKKDIELQFNEADDGFRFEELWFGEFSYEMFDYSEEILESGLLERISNIMQGKTAVIIANDIKNKRWLGDAGFDRSDDSDDTFGEPGYQKAIRRIQRKKGLFAKIFQSKTQYEIYDWNSYKCIIK